MGRKATLLGFWIVGYVFGFVAWEGKDPAMRFVEGLGITASTAEALLAGLFGSSVMVLTVLIWSFFASSK